MKIVISFFIFLSFISAENIRVATAANVSYAINELKDVFIKENPKIKVDVILGSSGKLTAQILHGAPYDIFLSANMKYPNKLKEESIAITEPIIYAKGGLVILTRKDDINLSKGIEVVKDVKRIAIANYKTAPYGKASVEALKNAKLLKIAKPKFINAENISQSVQYTITATDIGFIAKSAMFSDKMKKYKNWVEVDKNLYKPIEQGLVILKHAKDKNSAKVFYDFLLSSKAKEIFKKYGYIVEIKD